MAVPELDFSELFSIAPEAPESPKNVVSIVDSESLPLPSNAVQKRIEANRRTLEDARHICKERAEQIRQSAALRSEIMRGLNEGMSTEAALLKAAEVIQLITGDTVFYNHIKGVICTSY